MLTISIDLLDEPKLLFGNNRFCADPKVGLTSYGPAGVDIDKGESRVVNAGAIGSFQALTHMRVFLSRLSYAIPFERKLQPQPWKLDFPGLGTSSPLSFDIRLDESNIQPISEMEEQQALGHDDRKLRIEKSVDLYEQKFQDLVTSSTSLPHVVLLPLSKRLVERCRDPSAKADRIVYQKRTMDKRLHTNFPMFDFHHVLKVISFRHNLTCQMILPATMSFAQGRQESATIAWNFATAAYYKGTGIPWKLADLDPRTCLVGISFYEEVGEAGSSMRASMAHVYVKSSESQVIRGKPFRWDSDDLRREPSLNQEQASEVLTDVLSLFRRQKLETPSRVVVHKSSPFTEQEIDGFNSASSMVESVDYVHIQSKEGIRFYHEGQDYPPVRGTFISSNESPSILYSVGFVPSLGTYLGGTTPFPLVLTTPRNDTSLRQIGKDILSLTKLDWNSTDFCTREPVTTSVSRKVGHILAEMRARNVKDPPQPYRFYM